MPHSLQDPLGLIIAVAAFGLVLSVWFGALVLWHARRAARGRKIEQRLGITPSDPTAPGTPGSPDRVLRLWRDGQEVTTTVPGASRTVARRFERMRINAGWQTPMRTILIGLAGVSAFAFVLGLALTGSLLIGIGGIVVVTQVFWIVLQHKISKRATLFERQFVDALELAARSLRVGHPLVGSFELIAAEVGDPVGPIFAEIVQQQGLGMPLGPAIRQAADENASEDFKLFATSVVIQLRSGGNLADMMDRLATVLRERTRLARRVRVLTAQTQFSKRVLLALPVLTLVALNLLNPSYMSILWTTTAGNIVLGSAGAGLVLGGWMMSVLAKQRT